MDEDREHVMEAESPSVARNALRMSAAKSSMKARSRKKGRRNP
jgi:hypothetical protein